MDKLGHHALSCRKSAGRFARHTEVNEIIHLAMRTAKVPATLEPAGLSRSYGKRPDGCTLAPWARGQLLAWDFTLPDTLASSYIRHATAGAGHVAAAAEEKKKTKYSCLPAGYFFLPVAIETFGSFGPGANQLVEDLSRRSRRITGDPRSQSHLLQRLSLAVQRGNSACILGGLYGV